MKTNIDDLNCISDFDAEMQFFFEEQPQSVIDKVNEYYDLLKELDCRPSHIRRVDEDVFDDNTSHLILDEYLSTPKVYPNEQTCCLPGVGSLRRCVHYDAPSTALIENLTLF